MISYFKTNDTSLQPKRYYTLSGGNYTLVTSPNVANINTYYERKSDFPIMSIGVKSSDSSTMLSGTTFTDLSICPTAYKWSIEDISDSDAGRTEDLKMQKKRIGQCIKLELEWKNLNVTKGAKIISTFNPEYLFIEYLDAMSGTFECREFYMGNRATPLYNCALGVWSSITFNIIERSCAR